MLNRLVFWLYFFLVAIITPLVQAAQIPLEVLQFKKLPSSEQINEFLKGLAKQSGQLKLIEVGHSAGGRSIYALLVSNDKHFLEEKHADKNKLTVMLTGSMHGTEPSGSEALQKVALQLVEGELKPYLNEMNFILVVNANPDGRDNHERGNQNGNSINVDFLELESPEAQSFVNLLESYKPDAFLDLHESSTKKPILSNIEGYTINSRIQYESANNLNIEPQLLRYMQEILLPNLLQVSDQKGLPSQHYRGEILKLDQPISHGGLRISNLRNYSALKGTASFLVENRLDVEADKNAIPKNIHLQMENHYQSVLSFLHILKHHKNHLKSHVNQAREAWKHLDKFNMSLNATYMLNARNPEAAVSLVEMKSGKVIDRLFPNHNIVNNKLLSAIPRAYAVTTAQKNIAKLLTKHHIHYTTLQRPILKKALIPQVTQLNVNHPDNPLFKTTYEAKVNYNLREITLHPGDLYIDTNQPNGLLAALLLDIRSMDSIFQEQAYRELLTKGKTVGIFSIN